MSRLNKIKKLMIYLKSNDGISLIELVMTIILIGIMSIGLYNVVLFGVNDYIMNENVLHQTNSMSLANSVIRRNLVNAATPPVFLINGKINGQICYIKNKINPGHNKSAKLPIVVFNLASQPKVCGSAANPCNAVAFYKYVINGTTPPEQELAVFCVYNNVLYKQVTTKTSTTAYPVANNINDINIPPPAATYCNQNAKTKIYSCNINFNLTSTSGYSGVIYNGTSGVSAIVANPQ